MTERLPKHLTRFFESQKQAQEAIEDLQQQEPDIDKPEIFRRLTKDKSPGRNANSHWSGHYKEGKLKRKSAN